jgi:hypothetical protein
MIQAMFKFVAVWFAALLLTGAAVYFSSVSVDALDPVIEIERQKNCDMADTGFDSGGKAQCLEQVERYLESELADARSNLVYWHAMAGIMVLVIGLIFMVQIVQRSATAGVPADFRSMKGPWLGYLLAILGVAVGAAALAHVTEVFGQWATILNPARGWGIPAFMALVWPLAFWGGTFLGAPDKMKPSIPGA